MPNKLLSKRAKVSNNVRLGNIDVANFLYLAGFALYFLWSMFGTTTYEASGLEGYGTIRNLLVVLSVGCLVLKLFMQEYTFNQAAFLTLVLLCFAPSAYYTHSYVLIWVLLLIAASQNIALKQIARVVLFLGIAVLALTALFSKLGLLISTERGRFDSGIEYSSFGFSHPNSLGIHITTVSVAYAVVRYQSGGKYVAKDYMIQVIALLAILLVVNSRTAAVANACIIAMQLILSRTNQATSRKRFLIFCGGILAIACALSLFLIVVYDLRPFERILDNAVSGRIAFGHIYFEAYGLTPWGASFVDASNFFPNSVLRPLDNAYGYLFIHFGYVAGLSFVILVAAFFHRSIKAAVVSPAVIGLVTFGIMGMGETAMLYAASNFCLIGLADVVYSSKTKDAAPEGCKVRSG